MIMEANFNDVVNVSKIINIHYFEFVNKYHTIENFHNFCELLYVDRGSITVHSENFSGILFENQLIIHRPNERHSLECNDSVAPNVIIVGFECLSEDIELFSKIPATLQSNQIRILSKVMNEGMKAFSPPYDLPNTTEMQIRPDIPYAAVQLTKLHLEMLLISILRDIKKEKEANSGAVEEESKISAVHKYLLEHFTEKITLDNLCFLFRTNKTTLCREFKNIYGLTISNYINKLRVDEAKVLIRKNELSITEIAESLGFDSIHYFCKLFKKTTNQSAKEYFKSIRANPHL